jgi:hypothetical protein
VEPAQQKELPVACARTPSTGSGCCGGGVEKMYWAWMCQASSHSSCSTYVVVLAAEVAIPRCSCGTN